MDNVNRGNVNTIYNIKSHLQFIFQFTCLKTIARNANAVHVTLYLPLIR